MVEGKKIGAPVRFFKDYGKTCIADYAPLLLSSFRKSERGGRAGHGQFLSQIRPIRPEQQQPGSKSTNINDQKLLSLQAEGLTEYFDSMDDSHPVLHCAYILATASFASLHQNRGVRFSRSRNCAPFALPFYQSLIVSTRMLQRSIRQIHLFPL